MHEAQAETSSLCVLLLPLASGGILLRKVCCLLCAHPLLPPPVMYVLLFVILQLPSIWAAAAYPSSKPLGVWMADLVKRVAFVRQWLTTGQPAIFWLPGGVCYVESATAACAE